MSFARTPIGAFQGTLKNLTAPELGAAAIKGALERSSLNPDQIDEVIMGNVLPAGTGQAPARQACIYSGLPNDVECLTVNKMCGSGLKAVMLGTQAIACGDAEIIAAGGMESMSNTPYYLPGSRGGLRLGHGKVMDGIIQDGLWDVYNDKHMGNCAELCARKFNLSRDDQDSFASESYARSLNAIVSGFFKEEIIPISIPQRRGDPLTIDTDEEPGRGRPEKISRLKPAFERDGTVTAANASSINDGAAALIILSGDMAEKLGLKPAFKIIGLESFAQQPEWFTTAPVNAMKKLSAKVNIDFDDIDLYEINEAFSVVTLAAMHELNLHHEKVNIHGGAVSLGHPIGASGARILCTLLSAMNQMESRLGMASICIGGGEASAMLVERV